VTGVSQRSYMYSLVSNDPSHFTSRVLPPLTGMWRWCHSVLFPHAADPLVWPEGGSGNQVLHKA